jgi:hypothetical protein
LITNFVIHFGIEKWEFSSFVLLFQDRFHFSRPTEFSVCWGGYWGLNSGPSSYFYSQKYCWNFYSDHTLASVVFLTILSFPIDEHKYLSIYLNGSSLRLGV